jgi:WD40 repeat protein
MWDQRWLKTMSFWVEAGLFIFIILLLVIAAVVKPALPGADGSPTPAGKPIETVFYYFEIDPVNFITKIWQSTEADVNTRREIAMFSHAADSLPVGSLSPDGTQIAMLISPPDAPNDSDGNIWLIRTDGTNIQQNTEGAFSWFAWKQDSQALALFSQARSSDQTGKSKGLITRLSKKNLKTGETTLILEEDSSLDAKPMGWSAGGDEFVMMTLSEAGKWLVISVKVDSGAQVIRFKLPENDLLRNAWLSPNGAYLLMDLIRGEKAVLMLYSLDGRQQVEIATIGIGLFSDPTSFAAVWSPDGQRILLNQPSASLSKPTWMTYDLQGGFDVPVYLGEVDSNHYLRPLDWSPDGKWLAMAETPFPYARLYIKEISATDRLRLPLENPANFASWLGWAPGY